MEYQSFFGHANDVILDKRRSFFGALLGMLDAALPLQHGPAVDIVLRQLRKDTSEINLTVAQRTKTARTIDPRLISAINSALPGWIKFRILHMKGFDIILVDIDKSR